MNEKKRERILSQVQALYAKAASSDFGPEADAFTAKADELMLKYAIEQAELAMDDPSLHEFEMREFDFKTSYRSEIYNVQYGLLASCARHCDLKMCPSLDVDGIRYAGSRGDLDYMEILYTGLLSHLVKTLDPKPDPDASEAENLYGLKMAGFKWADVHYKMYPDVPWSRTHGVRYTRVVKKFAEERGLERNMVGGAGGQRNYREQYASAYMIRIRERLAELKDGQQEARKGAEIVLFNKEDRLKEFMWDTFPELRPHEADCDCDQCHRCRDRTCQRSRCRAARQPIPKYRKSDYRTIQYNPTANAAGRRAANTADLQQTKLSGKQGQLR